MARVTGIEVQSYETDAGLLAELRESWPVAGASLPAKDGFRPIDLSALPIVGAIRLTDRLGVALAAHADGSFAPMPMAREEYGGPWRRARAGDGLSAFVAGVPEASERAIGTDQTHESVVVGERAILKWFRHVGPGPSRAALLLDHLVEVRFRGIPTPLGRLAWPSPSGVELTPAQGDVYLPEARDGWEWAVERGERNDADVGRELGELVAALHLALSTPSSVIEHPGGSAGREHVGRWKAEALATLDAARAVTREPGLELWEPAMRSVIDRLAARSIPIVPVHGDLHVGQVLESPRGLAVIDFDGNPTLAESANAVRQPRERDIAQMVTSIDHVGRVVEKRSGRDRSRWIAEARAGFLDAVGPVDEPLLDAFEVEQECRELVYAARFLPRWTYAPMATLRARFG
ncbi:MAG: phosphotransferase [Chloroflexota bacterium]